MIETDLRKQEALDSDAKEKKKMQQINFTGNLECAEMQQFF